MGHWEPPTSAAAAVAVADPAHQKQNLWRVAGSDAVVVAAVEAGAAADVAVVDAAFLVALHAASVVVMAVVAVPAVVEVFVVEAVPIVAAVLLFVAVVAAVPASAAAPVDADAADAPEVTAAIVVDVAALVAATASGMIVLV